jgi:hypothetical protein
VRAIAAVDIYQNNCLAFINKGLNGEMAEHTCNTCMGFLPVTVGWHNADIRAKIEDGSSTRFSPWSDDYT